MAFAPLVCLVSNETGCTDSIDRNLCGLLLGGHAGSPRAGPRPCGSINGWRGAQGGASSAYRFPDRPWRESAPLDCRMGRSARWVDLPSAAVRSGFSVQVLRDVHVPFLRRILSRSQRGLHRYRLGARRRGGSLGDDREWLAALAPRAFWPARSSAWTVPVASTGTPFWSWWSQRQRQRARCVNISGLVPRSYRC